MRKRHKSVMRLVYRITNEVLRDLIRSEHNGFLSLLMEKVNIQREIAIQNNKLTMFNEIYGNLL